MRRLTIVAALGALAIAVAGVMAGATGEDFEIPDIGTGERLALVIADEYQTEAAAEAANADITIADMAGFYVAPTGSFEGMTPGRWLVLTAFRTLAGALEFQELTSAADVTTRIAVAGYTGTGYVGLGQEANPDGSGPLQGPLPNGHPDKL